MNTISVHTVSL